MRSCTIIIPVYNSFAETEACLRSVLRSSESPYRVLVIDDASPDGELREHLPADILGHPRLAVVRNQENLGFVKSCNRGMRSAAHDDVILLNSDTEVTAGWLGRLRQAAYSSPRIGTVTPLTNSSRCRNSSPSTVSPPATAWRNLRFWSSAARCGSTWKCPLA